MKNFAAIVFWSFLTIFAFGGAVFWSTVPALAQPYVVSGLAVDARADNAVMAREKAFGEALQQSFSRLLEQLVPDPAARSAIRTPETAELGRMLQDFSTTNEKLSSTRYTATYEMRFKPARVQAFLSKASVVPLAASGDQTGGKNSDDSVFSGPSSSSSSSSGAGGSQAERSSPAVPLSPILIIPFYQAEGVPVLWAAANPLRDALVQQMDDHQSFKFPLGDLEDVQIFDEARGLSYQPEQMEKLLKKYEVKTALLAVAIPDRQEKTEINVMMYRASLDQLQPVYVDTFSMKAKKGEDFIAFYTRIATQLRMQAGGGMIRKASSSAIEQEQHSSVEPMAVESATNEPDSLPVQSMPMMAHFQSLMEWQQVRSRLVALPMVQSVRVASLKTTQARIELLYRGPMDQLLLQIQVNGLIANPVVSASDDAVQINPIDSVVTSDMGSDQKESAAVYDVSLNPTTMVPESFDGKEDTTPVITPNSTILMNDHGVTVTEPLPMNGL